MVIKFLRCISSPIKFIHNFFQPKNIGLSLSRCVSDIAEGKVLESRVIKIVTATNCRNGEDWNKIITRYRRIYWSSFPDESEAIVRRLINAGKVEQPRLQNDNHFPNISAGHWVKNESQIHWQDNMDPWDEPY